MRPGQVVNLTPHPLVLHDESGQVVVTLPRPSVAVPRLEVTHRLAGTIDHIPVFTAVYGACLHEPTPHPGVHYIVSSLVRRHLRHRTDLVTPGPPVRDASGTVVGAIGLLH